MHMQPRVNTLYTQWVMLSVCYAVIWDVVGWGMAPGTKQDSAAVRFIQNATLFVTGLMKLGEKD